MGRTEAPARVKASGLPFTASVKDTFARNLIFDFAASHTGIGDMIDTKKTDNQSEKTSVLRICFCLLVDGVSGRVHFAARFLEPLPRASHTRRPFIQWAHRSCYTLGLFDIPAHPKKNYGLTACSRVLWTPLFAGVTDRSTTLKSTQVPVRNLPENSGTVASCSSQSVHLLLQTKHRSFVRMLGLCRAPRFDRCHAGAQKGT